MLTPSAVWDDHHVTKAVALGSTIQLHVVRMMSKDILQKRMELLPVLQGDQTPMQSPR